MSFKEPKGKWFKELKQNRKDYKKVENAISSYVLINEKESRLFEWMIGIGLAILLSFSVTDIFKSQIKWIVTIATIMYIFSFMLILIGIIIERFNIQRQKIAIMWLYREKDKQ